MPTFSLICPNCKHEWTDFMWLSEREKAVCPKCGAKAETNYHDKNGTVLIKGKGFYQERTVR